MAPKKDKKDAKKGQEEQDVNSLYVKREPRPVPEAPDAKEAADLWKSSRAAYLACLPEWSDEGVDTLEWKPQETETLFMAENFTAKALPKNFMQQVNGWRRASHILESSGVEEREPEAAPMPDLEEAPPAPDPKAKAKPEPKKKGKEEVPPAKPTTVQQFENIIPPGEACVVTSSEFRTRELALTMDDGMPALSQAIASHFAIIAEHKKFLPRGCFLWELIYPQDGDGVPLFNPHGKYVVKLFLHGKWRQVLIDDVMPVGIASGQNMTQFAPVFPASTSPHIIWPQLLAKAILRAFPHPVGDLSSMMLPVITALTGWVPFKVPCDWQSLKDSISSRLFCCVQMMSAVDIEARRMEALMASNEPKREAKAPAPGMPAVPALNLAGPGPAVPKLAAYPSQALLQFIVCELEEEPRQARIKASIFRPVGGTPRRLVLKDADSEAEQSEEEDFEDHKEQFRSRGEDTVAVSENEELDDDEDEERRSQRSPSGGEATVPSARSKEEGTAAGAQGDDAAGGEGEDGSGEGKGPMLSPWPESPPAPMLLRSLIQEHVNQLSGGYWVQLDALTEACTDLVVYVPPGEHSLVEVLDTVWAADRKKAFVPQPPKLLRLRLRAEADSAGSQGRHRQRKPPPDTDKDGDAARGPRWHKAVIMYEPMRPDPADQKASAGAPTGGSTCVLECVNRWQYSPTADGTPPQTINLAVGDGPTIASPGSSLVASKSVLLPPGEHWYLVNDEAVRAGSVLAVHVDGSSLDISESSISFIDPFECKESDEGLDVVVASVEPREYPIQQGFSIWAKAEITMDPEVANVAQYLQLVSYVSDPTLRPHLRVTFIRVAQDIGCDPVQQCARWSVERLSRSPMPPMTALPLQHGYQPGGTEDVGNAVRGDDEGAETQQEVKYVMVLEANVPSPTPSGQLQLNLVLPPDQAGVITALKRSEDRADSAGLSPLQVKSLKADHVIRWGSSTEPNDKGIVMRERLTVPAGSNVGEVTAALRISVSGLKRAYLKARLMAQLPPTEDMRPQKLNDAGEPVPLEPLPIGSTIEPREYGGRKNWLASCVTVVEECGVEVVLFPHVILLEGSTYLMDVRLDPYKGPDKLEGGEWSLEIFGSGDVEVGADTMEQDLEALVRKSWEPATQEPGQPTRKEKASLARRRWMRDRGLLSEEDAAKLAAEEQAAAQAPAVPDKKGGKDAKGKRPSEEPEAGIDVGPSEADRLQQAMERVTEAKYTNDAAGKFVHEHTKVEAVLIAEDPYTIAPVSFDIPPDPTAPQQDPDAEVAVAALSAAGLSEVHEMELMADEGKWDRITDQLEEAKETNSKALNDLASWREEQAVFEFKFLQARENLRGGLQARFEKRALLKDAVQDPEKGSIAHIRAPLDEAVEAGVTIWDAALVEAAGSKIKFIEGFATFKAALDKAKAEEATEEGVNSATKDELKAAVELATAVLKDMGQRSIPLPLPPVEDVPAKDKKKGGKDDPADADLPYDGWLEQAELLLQDPPEEADEDAAES